MALSAKKVSNLCSKGCLDARKAIFKTFLLRLGKACSHVYG